MAVSPFDSAIYRDLFFDAEVGKLFTDTAEVRAMMLVEGALAKAQGEVGLIPEISAAFLNRAVMEIQIDPAGLAAETGKSAVVVPALVGAMRKAFEAPEHAQYLHWGATSQDIMETGLILRLRQVISTVETRLIALAKALGKLAETHADLPMAARTYGQVATPTSFGAIAAEWGGPVLRHLERLREMRQRLLIVQLAGAAGTLSAMGPDGPAVRAAMARILNLSDPGASGHSQRDRMDEFTALMTGLTGSLGKMGEDLIMLAQSELAEVSLPNAGGSSTMPQKQNPVQPSVLVALARLTAALNAPFQGAAIHRQQRDGAAWMVEWLTLPQICMATAKALAVATDLAEGITPRADAMARNLDDGSGLVHAEALSFAMARHMPRPEAQAAVKTLCADVRAGKGALSDLAIAAYPDLGLSAVFSAEGSLGTAPTDARNFAERTTFI